MYALSAPAGEGLDDTSRMKAFIQEGRVHNQPSNGRGCPSEETRHRHSCTRRQRGCTQCRIYGSGHCARRRVSPLRLVHAPMILPCRRSCLTCLEWGAGRRSDKKPNAAWHGSISSRRGQQQFHGDSCSSSSFVDLTSAWPFRPTRGRYIRLSSGGSLVTVVGPVGRRPAHTNVAVLPRT